MPLTIGPIENRRPEHIGLAKAGGTDAEKYPTLARALKNHSPAHNTKIEWTVEGQDYYGDPENRTWFNWLQINRTPFGMSSTAGAFKPYGEDTWAKIKSQMLSEHLATVEQTLAHGVLYERVVWRIDPETLEMYSTIVRTAGGAEFYLRRDLVEEDVLSLRTLRDTVFFDTTTPDLDGKQGEFLTEFSLQVVPAKITAKVAA